MVASDPLGIPRSPGLYAISIDFKGGPTPDIVSNWWYAQNRGEGTRINVLLWKLNLGHLKRQLNMYSQSNRTKELLFPGYSQGEAEKPQKTPIREFQYLFFFVCKLLTKQKIWLCIPEPQARDSLSGILSSHFAGKWKIMHGLQSSQGFEQSYKRLLLNRLDRRRVWENYKNFGFS